MCLCALETQYQSDASTAGRLVSAATPIPTLCPPRHLKSRRTRRHTLSRTACVNPIAMQEAVPHQPTCQPPPDQLSCGWMQTRRRPSRGQYFQRAQSADPSSAPRRHLVSKTNANIPSLCEFGAVVSHAPGDNKPRLKSHRHVSSLSLYHLIHYVNNKTCLANLGRQKKKTESIVLSGDGETICRHSIYNELESDSGKSMLIK